MSMLQPARAPREQALSGDETSTPAEMSKRREPPVRDVFDTPAAAEYLGISAATLELLRVRGGGPSYVKLKRLVRYRRAALDEWLLSRERRSTSERDGGAA